jgi:hypothetical protein
MSAYAVHSPNKHMKTLNRKLTGLLSAILLMMACSLPGLAAPTEETPSSIPTDASAASVEPVTETVQVPSETPAPTIKAATPTIVIPHSLVPSTSIDKAKLTINDVVSVDTAPENRAPYGDSYKGNLFERPFMEDMAYLADIDIVSYSLAYDEKFFYVSIELVGANPNNEIGIDYGVEMDINADGFGDYIIIARPPYNVKWTTDHVQIVQDTNRDTAGLSPERSDAPLPGDGYDTVVFDGGLPDSEDPDIAWVRVNAGKEATVQFAFKRTFFGEQFMFGVLADAGTRSIEDLDYSDRFTELEAGSPEKSEKDYPLKALYGVDNVCRAAYGFVGTGDEPRRCPEK